jgi:hypothetical protein
MGWHGGTILAMLWMYLDESGEHDRRDGHLRRLALGGGIAPFASWEALSLEWSATLESFEIPMFHMADFEARAKPFFGWEGSRRRALLAQLLDIAIRHIPIFWGTAGTGLHDGAAFRQHYLSNLAKLVAQMAPASRDAGATYNRDIRDA